MYRGKKIMLVIAADNEERLSTPNLEKAPESAEHIRHK